MKKYPEPLPTDSFCLRETSGHDTLEFPISDFVSHPPKIELQAMLRRIEENMPWRNQRPGAREQRLAEKISAEFVL